MTLINFKRRKYWSKLVWLYLDDIACSSVNTNGVAIVHPVKVRKLKPENSALVDVNGRVNLKVLEVYELHINN